MVKKRIKINVMTITVRELREVLFNLPVIAGGTEPEKHQMIEGAENNARFQITKEESGKHSGCIFYVVRVSGSSEDSRLSLISKFKELLGDPSMPFLAKALSDADSFYWDIKKVDEEAVS